MPAGDFECFECGRVITVDELRALDAKRLAATDRTSSLDLPPCPDCGSVAWRIYGHRSSDSGVRGETEADAVYSGLTEGAKSGDASPAAADPSQGASSGVDPEGLVIGWRCWKLLVEGDSNFPPTQWSYWLTAFVMDDDERRGTLGALQPMRKWGDGPVTVADQKPGRYDSYGLWAVKPDHLARLPVVDYNGQLTGAASYAALVGTVGLFGHVVEGEDGYRAEKAVIRSLWLISPKLWIARIQVPPDVVLDKLSVRYDVARDQCHAGTPPELREVES